MQQNNLMILLILFLFPAVTFGDELHKPIFKCCREGEELHSNGRDCIQRPGHKIQIMDDDEQDYLGDPAELKSLSVYWLPLSVLNKLPNVTLFVKYRNISLCQSQSFILLNTNNTDRYTFTDDYSLNVSFTNTDGDYFIIEFQTSKYCLDSISGSRGPHVFRMCDKILESNYTVIRKCCNFGHSIKIRNTVAMCEYTNDSTWAVQDSIFRKYIDSEIITDIMDDSISLCSDGEFKILLPDDLSKYFNGSFNQVVYYLDHYYFTQYDCFDFLSDELENNETIGICYHTSKPLLAYFLVFRHFPVLVALALGLGLIILGSRSDISQTLHGKALLCHILSLCIGHILHAVWEYKIQDCKNTTLIVLNFFMMSSVLWLNAICINMARGFGAPLENRKKRNRWTVFAWYNLYVWGCSLLHTVLLATQPWKKYSDRDIIAYLYHTRTCFTIQDWQQSPNLGTLIFGYGPASILLIINVCLLASTILKIRKMQRNTSILQRRLSINIIKKHKTMLKYMRLLLTTGVGETAAEMAALWTRIPTFYDAEGTRLMDDELWYMRMVHTETLFRILATICDLLRALSVLVLSCSTGDTFPRIRKGWRAIWETAFARCRKQNSDTDGELNDTQMRRSYDVNK